MDFTSSALGLHLEQLRRPSKSFTSPRSPPKAFKGLTWKAFESLQRLFKGLRRPPQACQDLTLKAFEGLQRPGAAFEGLQRPSKVSKGLRRPHLGSLRRPHRAHRAHTGTKTAQGAQGEQGPQGTQGAQDDLKSSPKASKGLLKASKGLQRPHLEGLRRPPDVQLQKAQQKAGFIRDIQQKRRFSYPQLPQPTQCVGTRLHEVEKVQRLSKLEFWPSKAFETRIPALEGLGRPCK